MTATGDLVNIWAKRRPRHKERGAHCPPVSAGLERDAGRVVETQRAGALLDAHLPQLVEPDLPAGRRTDPGQMIDK